MIPHSRVSHMCRISNWRSFAFILLDYAVIALAIAIAVAADQPAVSVIAILLVAGRQVALTNIMHSAAHYALFSPKRWNEALELLYALPILDSVRVYRGPHFEHHREFTLNLPERFEYLHGELGLPGLSAWGRTWVVFVRPFLGYAGAGFVKSTVRSMWRNKRYALKVAIFWLILGAGAYHFGWLCYVALYWFIPLVYIYPIFNMWAEISDHFEAETTGRNHRGILHTVFLKCHDRFHHIHHCYPYIPFYCHPEVHTCLAARGERMETSTGVFDFLRCVYKRRPST
jgi:fatty acid desaturase